jgi:hypothetical protein
MYVVPSEKAIMLINFLAEIKPKGKHLDSGNIGQREKYRSVIYEGLSCVFWILSEDALFTETMILRRLASKCYKEFQKEANGFLLTLNSGGVKFGYRSLLSFIYNRYSRCPLRVMSIVLDAIKEQIDDVKEKWEFIKILLDLAARDDASHYFRGLARDEVMLFCLDLS